MVRRKLKCSVCVKFRSSLIHKRNFSDRLIAGGARTSNIRDHAIVSEQHSHAMKQRTGCSYATKYRG